MTILAKTVFALLLSTLAGDASEQAERVQPIAQAIADAAEAEPLWQGETGVRDTAALLVAVGWHESGWREAVRRCAVRGDHGRSLGAYQLGAWAREPYASSEVCDSDALQARLALRVLHRHRARGVRGVPALMRAYAAGNAAVRSRAAEEMTWLFERTRRRAEVLSP